MVAVMFGPQASLTPSISSSRNPRRRQRNHSDENGVSLPKAKRQRSAIHADTFVKPATAADDPEQTQPTVPAPNGSVSVLPRGGSIDIDIPVRGTKKTRERGGDGDGSVVLTKNSQYVVTRLPALPDHIRSNPQDSYQGGVFGDASYAVALTATHALVWPYTSTAPSPETFSFTLPYPSKNSSDPLPLGALVTASTATVEPGLVVVMPSTGKITYWESITSAAALDLIRQQRLGVEGSVGSLLSGEVVVQVENAEPAGFTLSFSSGRIALLSLRDGHGRPAVAVTFLKHASPATGGGLFAGLRQVFTAGAWRRDVVAVRSGPAKKGERTVGVATAKGMLQLWQLHRGGHHVLQTEIDARDDIVTAIKRAKVALEGKTEDDFEVLDFTFSPRLRKSPEADLAFPSDFVSLLLLVAVTGSSSSAYAILELTVAEANITARPIHTIHAYTTRLRRDGTLPPRLFVPNPGHTGFIVFDRAVLVAHLNWPTESPDQQLLADTQPPPRPFEDVVDFRHDLDLAIVGAGPEDGRDANALVMEDVKNHRRRTKDPGCVLLLQGYGVLRLAAYEPPDDPQAVDADSVQSQIEQAVQYGGDVQNPLNFSGRAEVEVDGSEVEAAALRVSLAILDSRSKAINLVTPSMDQQLKQRAVALRQLANHIRETYPPLTRLFRWQLLWHAEKLAAARTVWRLYDARIRGRTTGKEQALLAQAIDMMNENLNEQADEALGEFDRVRHWFQRNVVRTQYLVIWAYQSVSEIQRTQQQDYPTLAGLVSEANDISIGALETAFRFRQENLALYDLADERLVDGVLQEGYEGFPEVWTSHKLAVTTTKSLVDLAREFAISYWGKPAADGAPDPAVINKIRLETIPHVHVCCQLYEERARWLMGQEGERQQLEGRKLREFHQTLRGIQIGKLSSLDLTDEAMALAEQYRDMPTLVHLLAEEITRVAERANAYGVSQDEAAQLEDRLSALQDRVDNNFTRFGDAWAHALFSAQIVHGKLAELMHDFEEWPQYLTRFLRANPAYAKLSWMNDVAVERDYATAGQTILDYARAKESDLWSKKMELSVGKLARLAAVQDDAPGLASEAKRTGWIDDELTLIDIQRQLADHVAPALHGALDEKAAVELAMSAVGTRVVAGKPALTTILEQALTDLVARRVLGVWQLTDMLSLMDDRHPGAQSDSVTGRAFFLALRALASCRGDSPAAVELSEKMVWRRCMIRDRWDAINQTQLQDDGALEQATRGTALFTTLQACYRHGASMRPRVRGVVFAPSDEDASALVSRVRLLRPSEVVGAGCTADELHERFPDDLGEPVAADVRQEDAALQRYIEKGRLEEWYAGIVAAAQKSVHSELMAEEQAMTRLGSIEEAIEGPPKALANGHTIEAGAEGFSAGP
ncbi:MAG: hypothetical protein M1838_003552 [Thelocarpon superellum]|nr:MAG: hypothetical protein M1838_003552 [Thelocarpon superellum]